MSEKKFRIVVLGSGAFGTALGHCAARNGHEVVIISSLKETVDAINTVRVHPSRLKDASYKLPPNVRASSDPNELRGADFILHTIPVQYSREALKKYEALGLIGDTPIISASKGIESVTLMYMSQLVPDVLGRKQRMAFLSGPSFAKELVENVPTAVVAAAEDPEMQRAVQDIFLSKVLRVYTSGDVIGTEVGGALKNVIAIGAGICAGMGLGLNSLAMLITRGTSEINRLAITMGAHPSTLSGLAGMGDLMLTCYGPLSRNRTVGRLLGEGKTMEEVRKLQSEVAEGVFTATAANLLCQKLKLELPIIAAVAAIVEGRLSAQDAVKKLLEIPVGPEIPWIQ
jgi:glycerol-3-phosphate dehydrogenase (NAD+)